MFEDSLKIVQLTVIIPTFNEAENLPKLVSALFALPIEDLKILVVDDNSPDGTGQLAEELALSITRDAWMCCTDLASSAWEAPISRAFDLPSRPGQKRSVRWTQISPTRPKKSRFCWRRCKVAMSPLAPAMCPAAVWMSTGRSGARRFRLLEISMPAPSWALPLRDVTGGFRVWRSETLSAMPLDRIRSNGYAFQVEMAYVAYRLGFTFKEIPIYFADRRWGLSKMSFRIQREAARRVWQMLYEHRRLRRKG